jgi:hypothetical protein
MCDGQPTTGHEAHGVLKLRQSGPRRLFTRQPYGPAPGDRIVISVVNGFLCTCSCDVSKAKRGVDPHPKTDDAQDSGKPETKNGVVTEDKSAVTFGGSLAAPTATSATVVTAASASQSSAQVTGQAVNLLV